MTTPDSASSIRSVAVAAYGPSFLSAIGTGAITPVVALSARELGATVSMAALVVGMLAIGQLLGDLPAGSLASRVGEKRALLIACVAECFGAVGCLVADRLWVLAGSVLLIGVATAVFNLARQSYLSVVIPVRMRARAMSVLGGVNRIGQFIGPIIGAGVISAWSLRYVYVIEVAVMVVALVLVAVSRDVTAGERNQGTSARPSVSGIFWAYRKVFATVGVGVMLLALARNSRTVIIPLWASEIGMSAAQISLVVGLAGAIDMLLFYPGGYAMDKLGRLSVAVPSMILLGAGLIVVGLASSLWSVALVAVCMGVGNGIGSGVVATLGADAAPVVGRPQFLASWRLMADGGAATGPVAMGGLVLVMPLALASATLGIVALAGAGWLALWVPRYDPTTSWRRSRRAQRSRPARH